MITQNLAELLSLPFLVKGRDAGAPWKGHEGYEPKDIFSTRYSIPGCCNGRSVSRVQRHRPRNHTRLSTPSSV